MAYNDGILYIANAERIFLIECKDRLGKNEKVRVNIEPTKITTFSPGLPIHGLFIFRKQINMYYSKYQLVMALETLDNQIDFSVLEITNLGREAFNYTLKQQREVVSRTARIDKVVKFTYIVNDKNVLYAIAMRDSGMFDIYWDMTLIDSPDNGKRRCLDLLVILVTVFDIGASFDTLYFWTPNGTIKQLSTKSAQQISY